MVVRPRKLNSKGFIFTLLSLIIFIVLTTLFTLQWTLADHIVEGKSSEVRLVKFRTLIDDYASTYKDILNISHVSLVQQNASHKQLYLNGSMEFSSRVTPLTELSNLYESGFIYDATGIPVNISTLTSQVNVTGTGVFIYPNSSEFYAGGLGISQIVLNMSVGEAYNSTSNGISDDASGVVINFSVEDSNNAVYNYSYVLSPTQDNNVLQIFFDISASKHLNLTFGQSDFGNYVLHLTESADLNAEIEHLTIVFGSSSSNPVTFASVVPITYDIGAYNFSAGVPLARG